MKDDGSKRDLLMEELLREDARSGADEEFLKDLELAMQREEAKQEPPRTSTAPLYWKAAAVAACAGIGGRHARVAHRFMGL